MQYVVKLKTNALNHAYSRIFERPSESVHEARPNFIWPLMLQIKHHLEALSMDLDILVDTC